MTTEVRRESHLRSSLTCLLFGRGGRVVGRLNVHAALPPRLFAAACVEFFFVLPPHLTYAASLHTRCFTVDRGSSWYPRRPSAVVHRRQSLSYHGPAVIITAIAASLCGGTDFFCVHAPPPFYGATAFTYRRQNGTGGRVAKVNMLTWSDVKEPVDCGLPVCKENETWHALLIPRYWN